MVCWVRRTALTALILVLSSGARAESLSAFPDDDSGRVRALALMQTLNATLLSARSATLTLDKWCADHRIAPQAKIVAQLVRGADKPITGEQRQRLEIGPDEPVAYRRVQLACGSHVLSEADNWYVPSRLTPEMNRVLETTDTPFGRAVQALNFDRKTVGAKLLWSPLPDGWELARPVAAPVDCAPAAAPAPLPIPPRLFEHRAVLYDGARRPFSEVVETYTSEVLALPIDNAAPR
ncbi:hypothetical protein [Chelatococcus reniformis]|uniref:Uncharacterized protein n=1 Tax=Chelatococcus reniformis TaxID=1494448 RepID=A0A916UC33_9HYPH|nr:hypothetical protein [Chelatococcus reniformis]GGC68148.1 hypothetical protein GCM10010994_28400 [Chelatococcus reniformis]